MKRYVIQTDHLFHNVSKIKAAAQGRLIYAVLKADGYGLGAAKTAALLREAGISRFAVCAESEAEAIRTAGITEEEILMLTPCPDLETWKRLISRHITGTLSGMKGAELAASAARELGTTARVHIKIDTGMGRFGFLPEARETILSLYRDFPELKIEGMYTHFYRAWNNEKVTEQQVSRLLGVAEYIKEAGFVPGILHAANSPALFQYPFALLDAVRPGSAFVGGGAEDLLPVGYLETEIIEIKTLPKRWNVGYGGGKKLSREIRVAVLPVGYTDGFSLSRGSMPKSLTELLSEIFKLLLGYLGRKPVFVAISETHARIIGKICMTSCMVDVTGIKVSIGDKVRLTVSPIFASPHLKREFTSETSEVVPGE